MFWSSGKDSAAALQAVRGELEIVSLVTTVNRPSARVAVHDVPEALLQRQASAMGLPLERIVIPAPCPNDEYEARVMETLQRFRQQGVDTVVFGDLHLQDIRDYRDGLLERVRMRGEYPLWHVDTGELALRMLDCGIRAVATCIDTTMLDAAFAGREFDRRFLEDLPADADPCGENGEFHTFVYNAPMFNGPVPFTCAGTRDEGRFCYATIAEA